MKMPSKWAIERARKILNRYDEDRFESVEDDLLHDIALAIDEERERAIAKVSAEYSRLGSSREERLIARGLSIAEAAIRAGGGA